MTRRTPSNGSMGVLGGMASSRGGRQVWVEQGAAESGREHDGLGLLVQEGAGLGDDVVGGFGEAEGFVDAWEGDPVFPVLEFDGGDVAGHISIPARRLRRTNRSWPDRW